MYVKGSKSPGIETNALNSPVGPQHPFDKFESCADIVKSPTFSFQPDRITVQRRLSLSTTTITSLPTIDTQTIHFTPFTLFTPNSSITPTTLDRPENRSDHQCFIKLIPNTQTLPGSQLTAIVANPSSVRFTRLRPPLIPRSSRYLNHRTTVHMELITT